MHTAHTVAPLALASLTIARAILATADRLPGATDAGSRELRAAVRRLDLTGAGPACAELADALAARTFRPDDTDDVDGDPRFTAMSASLAARALAFARAAILATAASYPTGPAVLPALALVCGCSADALDRAALAQGLARLDALDRGEA